MDRETKFWNKLADKYSRQSVRDEAGYQKKLEVTREYLQPDMEVLEIGCGTGSTAIAHAPAPLHLVTKNARVVTVINDFRRQVASPQQRLFRIVIVTVQRPIIVEKVFVQVDVV